jgi:predicted dehydrogenase
VSLRASGILGPTGVDELASALLEFSSGMTANLSCGVHYDVGRSARIVGDTGHIQFDAPWTPEGGRHGLENSFVIQRADREPETVRVQCDKATYAIEAELVLDSLPAQEAAWPAMSWADTLGNMRALDAWRAAIEDTGVRL